MSSLPTDIPESTGAPDWSALDVALSCPRCGYSLHMLTAPRCPECGLTFQWADVIEATRRMRRDSPLFEYRWRDRPIRSLFATLWLCLRPWKLWSVVKITDPPRVRSLLMWLPCMIALSGLGIWTEKFVDTLWSWAYRPPRFTLRQVVVYSLEDSLRYAANPAWWFVLSCVTLPVVGITLAALLVFRKSFIQHRILWGHQLRIAIYAWVGAETLHFLITVIMVAANAIRFKATWSGSWSASASLLAAVRLLYAAGPILLWVSLYFGFHRYLMLPRARLAASCITALVVFSVATLTLPPEYYIGGWQFPWLLPLSRWSPLDELTVQKLFIRFY